MSSSNSLGHRVQQASSDHQNADDQIQADSSGAQGGRLPRIENSRISPSDACRVDHLISGWREGPSSTTAHVLGVLPGEGVGPEVVAASLDVLSAIEEFCSKRFVVRFGPDPGPEELNPTGSVAQADAAFCQEVFDQAGALFCGPRRGRFVYELRERFDLFCKLTPVEPLPALLGAGAVSASTARDAQLIFVRENIGGLYFGSAREQRENGELREASHTFGYHRETVSRIVGLAARLAAARRGRLTVVLKRSGVPAISSLWLEAATAVEREFGVLTEILEIDNACYQVVAHPKHFDVVVSPNMFGDVLADAAALLLGSRGASFSGNFGDNRKAVYQTAHGAALDLAGHDVANPTGQILSLAYLLEESFGLPDLARAVRLGTESILAEGWRTNDVAIPGCTRVGTRDLGKRIAERVQQAASATEKVG